MQISQMNFNEKVLAFKGFIRWAILDGVSSAAKVGEVDKTTRSIFAIARLVTALNDMPVIEAQTAAVELAEELGWPDPMLLIPQYTQSIANMKLSNKQAEAVAKPVTFSQPMEQDKYI